MDAEDSDEAVTTSMDFCKTIGFIAHLLETQIRQAQQLSHQHQPWWVSGLRVRVVSLMTTFDVRRC